jgi:hypothetical protein
MIIFRIEEIGMSTKSDDDEIKKIAEEARKQIYDAVEEYTKQGRQYVSMLDNIVFSGDNIIDRNFAPAIDLVKGKDGVYELPPATAITHKEDK